MSTVARCEDLRGPAITLSSARNLCCRCCLLCCAHRDVSLQALQWGDAGLLGTPESAGPLCVHIGVCQSQTAKERGTGCDCQQVQKVAAIAADLWAQPDSLFFSDVSGEARTEQRGFPTRDVVRPMDGAAHVVCSLPITAPHRALFPSLLAGGSTLSAQCLIASRQVWGGFAHPMDQHYCLALDKSLGMQNHSWSFFQVALSDR